MHPLLIAAALAAPLLTAVPALAQSADLGDWSRVGDAAAASPSSATLTTAADSSGETPLSATSALLFPALEAALGPAVSLGIDAFEGSALQSSFTAAAGTTIRFDYRLDTVGFDAGFVDRAFAVIDGSTLVAIADTAASTVTGSFSHTFATAGNHAFAFGVVDVNDVAGVSTLSVGGFSVSGVPEPGAALLLLAGLGVVGNAVRRRRWGGAVAG